MDKPVRSFRFPYIIVGLALVIAVFYRAPRSAQSASVAQASMLSADPLSAVSTLEPVSAAPRPAPEPVVDAPSGISLASLSKPPPPAVRTPPVSEAAPVRPVSLPAPAIPAPSEEPVYPPDSYSHPAGIPAAPVVKPPRGVPPLRIAVVHHGDEKDNRIALTFDDGPNNKQTPQILDILRQHGVKGTFFVLGEQVKQNPQMLRRIVEEGHEVGNHSYSHVLLTKVDEERVRREIAQTQEEIHKVLNYSPRLLRPPYGAYRASALPIFEEFGLNIVLWSVDTYDWKRKGDAILKTVSRDTRNGSIVLFHDRKAETVRVLPGVLDDLLSRGFRPVTVSELTGLEPYDTGTPIARRESDAPPIQ